MNAAHSNELARGALAFAQDRGTDAYLAPGVPLLDTNLTAWTALNRLILAGACAANGTGEIERKPLLAYVAPGAAAMANPQPIVASLLDLPIDGVYVQPTRLDPVRDSLEKLARFVQFCAAVRDAELPIIVGRVGAFGLVLQALGITAFDSGLGHAEAHDLADLNRSLTEKQLAKQAEKGGGGTANRVYLTMFKTTMMAEHARPLLASSELRAELTCSYGCCRFRALEDLPDRARTTTSSSGAPRSTPWPRSISPRCGSRTWRPSCDAPAISRSGPGAWLTPHCPTSSHTDRWLRLLAREQHAAPV